MDAADLYVEAWTTHWLQPEYLVTTNIIGTTASAIGFW
jgi:hypothetical protein